MSDAHLHPHLRHLATSKVELEKAATVLSQKAAYRPNPSQVLRHALLERYTLLCIRVFDARQMYFFTVYEFMFFSVRKARA